MLGLDVEQASRITTESLPPFALWHKYGLKVPWHQGRSGSSGAVELRIEGQVPATQRLNFETFVLYSWRLARAVTDSFPKRRRSQMIF